MSKQSKKQRRMLNTIRYAAVLLIAALVIVAAVIFIEPEKSNESDASIPTIATMQENAAGSNGIVQSDANGQTVQPAESNQAQEANSGISVDVNTEVPASSDNETEPAVSAIDIAQIDQLIDRYYQAKIDNDVQTLNNIIDAEKEYNMSDLQTEMQVIDKFDNFKTYVLPGYSDNYFIVYVRYDIYFQGIGTGAPSLNHFIVFKDNDGYFYIYKRPVSGEFQSYLEETEKSDIVLQIKDEVNADMVKACEENVDLKFLMDMLTAVPEESTTADNAGFAENEEGTSSVEGE